MAILLVLFWACRPPSVAADPDNEDAAEESAEVDPLGPNAGCYLCHTTFVGEELSKTHLREEITCIECHGLSAGHANDEDIGATLPDVTFQRHEVEASCQKCHEQHDVPAKQVVARWLERKLCDAAAICTDCHGTHKIESPEDNDAENVAMHLHAIR